jgi:hypothetical protein
MQVQTTTYSYSRSKGSNLHKQLLWEKTRASVHHPDPMIEMTLNDSWVIRIKCDTPDKRWEIWPIGKAG